MGSSARFVQFPHPGREHTPPPHGQMPWNTGDHRRKFLVAKGRYQDSGEGTSRGEIAFWGEWEPPSVIERQWAKEGQLPRALHRPYWFVPGGETPRQNTDPWVFGQRMIYSNCKQLHTTSLRELPRGSVICFGSSVGGEFCLDTVFVVATSEPWSADAADSLAVDDAFRTCTAYSVATNPEHSALEFTLYRGATPDDPVAGMFSYVPARPLDAADGPRFARPATHCPDLVNPKSKQAAKGANTNRPLDEVIEAWDAVRHQVLAAGLVLGFDLETPARQDPPPGARHAGPEEHGRRSGRTGPGC